MTRKQELLLAKAERVQLSWDPNTGGRKSWLVFEDDRTYDLGCDENGARLAFMVERTLQGGYYPPDALTVFGRFSLEGRNIRVGDRLVQQAPLMCRFGGPKLAAAVEVYIVTLSQDHFEFGYVTTRFHFGRGIWKAVFQRRDGQLSLRVTSTSMPGSWLFWLGLPIARYLQLRARKRAVQEFRKL